MEKEGNEKISVFSICLTKEMKKKAKEYSKKVFSRTNVSGFFAYLINLYESKKL